MQVGTPVKVTRVWPFPEESFTSELTMLPQVVGGNPSPFMVGERDFGPLVAVSWCGDDKFFAHSEGESWRVEVVK